MSHSASLVLLGIFSGLSMNLVLQCGLGIAGIAVSRERRLPLVETGLGFISVLFLWLFFSYLLSHLSMGLFGYILCFPAAFLVYSGLEYSVFSLILKNKQEKGKTGIFNDGLTAASLFITLNLAGSFLEAAVLSFGFMAGTLLTVLVLWEIRRRSEMEAVPRFLRGSPLIIISMGLLSLITTSAALIFFRVMGG